MAGALLAAALAGGTVAVIGAALVGTGEHTTTIRELVPAPPSLPGEVSQTSQVRPLTVRAIYDRDAPGVVQVSTTTKVKLPQTDWFGSSTSEVFVLARAAWQSPHFTIRCGV